MVTKVTANHNSNALTDWPQLTHRYGLKGRVDVSVSIKERRRVNLESCAEATTVTSRVPLELKTGKMFRKQGTIEHRAQVQYNIHRWMTIQSIYLFLRWLCTLWCWVTAIPLTLLGDSSTTWREVTCKACPHCLMRSGVCVVFWSCKVVCDDTCFFSTQPLRFSQEQMNKIFMAYFIYAAVLHFCRFNKCSQPLVPLPHHLWCLYDCSWSLERQAHLQVLSLHQGVHALS